MQKSDYVKIISNVNNNKLGVYEVSYDYKKTHKKRVVNVVDKTAPEIVLKGDNPKKVCDVSSYKDDGYELSDNYDAKEDLKVVTFVTDSLKIYDVYDKSGNKTTVVRGLIDEDNEKPVIKFNDGKDITVYKDRTFKDSYTASDNCDGDITDKVLVTGSVDISKVGSYTLNYEVSDKHGNKESATRKITVKDKPKIDGTIYLTFDDGPSSTVTPGILDLLKKYNIKATFFVIGTTGNDDLIKREYEEGHTIGLHSYTHKYSIYKSEQTYFDDLNKISDKVEKITGVKSKIIRFPGGSSNTVSRDYSIGIMSRLTDKVESLGYSYFDWNVGSSDTATGNATKVCNNVKKRLSEGTNVVLMHDYSGKESNIKALECIIKYGLDEGYDFSKITSSTKNIHHYVAN